MEAPIGHCDKGNGLGAPRRILSSWKEISAYLGRGIRTVRRYEAQCGLPIHRPVARERGYVFAFSDELDHWLGNRPVLSARANAHDRPLDVAGLGNLAHDRNGESGIKRSARLPTLNSSQVRSIGQRLLGLRDTPGFAAAEKATPRRQSPRLVLEELLDTAIKITEADFGNVQLIDPQSRSLRIVCQCGFGPEFLRFFTEVGHGIAACGTAMRNHERVIVEDVMTDPLFTEEAHKVMVGASAFACQSSPFFDHSGKLLGVVSTHYRLPTRPTPSALRLLDNLLGKVSSSHVLPLFQSA